MKKLMVVRVTKEEFETEDGCVYKHMEPLDEVPTLEEFQKTYDNWFNMLVKKDG